jgi:hypothetical protein
MVEGASGLVEDGHVVGIHHWLHRSHIGMPAECRHGPEYYGLTTDHAVLLGAAGAGAESTPGGDENGCGALRSGHASSRTCRVKRSCWMSPQGLSGRNSPYHVGLAKPAASTISVGKPDFAAAHLHNIADMSKV